MPREIRIENLDVKQILELLTEIYKRHDYCDMVVDLKRNSIFFEPPAESPSPEHSINLRVPEEYQIPNELDQIIFDDELFRILCSRKKI